MMAVSCALNDCPHWGTARGTIDVGPTWDDPDWLTSPARILTVWLCQRHAVALAEGRCVALAPQAGHSPATSGTAGALETELPRGLPQPASPWRPLHDTVPHEGESQPAALSVAKRQLMGYFHKQLPDGVLPHEVKPKRGHCVKCGAAIVKAYL